MNLTILHTKVQEYINNNLEANFKKLAFKKSPFDAVSEQELMQQISGKLIAKSKLPTWYQTPEIYYPPKLNLEQTTSELVAQFKATLIPPGRMADLTGGFGVDSYFFSKRVDTLEYYELNTDLYQIATHNFKQLGAHNINTHNGDGIQLIKGHYKLIYIDPARRDAHKNKVFKLSDCSPDVVEHFEVLKNHCEQLLVKTSPMLDISMGLSQLKNVHKIVAIAVNNELKELLWFIDFKETTPAVKGIAINIKDKAIEAHQIEWGKQYKEAYSLPANYLYIPNASIMKLGHFGAICEQYELSKLHADTHFFTCEQLIDFPGRKFIIDRCDKYNKETMKPLVKSTSLVISRNFPLTVAALRKRWKIVDGGNNYLIFTTLQDGEKVVLSCRTM